MKDELIAKEELEKYSGGEFYMDCLICGKETLLLTHDGQPLCEDCFCSIIDPCDPLIPDFELRIKNFERKNKSPEYTIKEIKKAVSDHFGINENEIDIKTRKREIVTARQISMTICKLITKDSLSNIGSEHGGKDHATVLHSIKTVKNLFDTNRSFRENILPLLEYFSCEKYFF